MKKDTKIIIIIALVVVSLLSYITYYFTSSLNKSEPKKEINSSQQINNQVEEEPKEEVPQIVESTENQGKEVNVQVSSEQVLPFYILKEDDNTYTLIAKNSLGQSPYYTSEDCNSDNENGCVVKTNELNIETFLRENTNTWNNVGEFRLPNKDDITALKHENSYWLKEGEEKEQIDVSYYDSTSQEVKTDKIYNSHDVIPIIKVLKMFVES